MWSSAPRRSETRGGPPVLLVMGVGGSMLWWDDRFCHGIAARGRFVIRYDQRDTGRSVTYELGRPGYCAADLVADAVGVLDAHGVTAAHVVGVSAGGALAQLLALDYPSRVLSLVLVSTSRAVSGGPKLPPPSAELTAFLHTAAPDRSDVDAVVDTWRRTARARRRRRPLRRAVRCATSSAAASSGPVNFAAGAEPRAAPGGCRPRPEHDGRCLRAHARRPRHGRSAVPRLSTARALAPPRFRMRACSS